MSRVMSFLAQLPSTNYRIFMTMLIVAATAARYIASGAGVGQFHFDTWEPNWDWLTFLAVMAGIDTVQFGFKRKTHMETPPAGPDIEDAAQPATKEAS